MKNKFGAAFGKFGMKNRREKNNNNNATHIHTQETFMETLVTKKLLNKKIVLKKINQANLQKTEKKLFRFSAHANNNSQVEFSVKLLGCKNFHVEI